VTFSSLFGIFLVYPAVISLYSSFPGCELRPSTRAVYNLGWALHSLVADLYFWPNVSSDGQAAVDLVFDSGKLAYYEKLQTAACSYLRQVNGFYRLHKSFGKLLDKLKLHRLLEITVHTVSRYGHIRNVSDLTFEHKHQALKQPFHRGDGNQENHNWSIQSDLADEWKYFLAWTYFTLRNPSLSLPERQLYADFLISCFAVRYTLTSVSLYSPRFQRDAMKVFKGLTTPSFVEELSFLSRTSKAIRPSLFQKWVWPLRHHPSSYLTSNGTEAERMRIDTLVESNFFSRPHEISMVSSLHWLTICLINIC